MAMQYFTTDPVYSDNISRFVAPHVKADVQESAISASPFFDAMWKKRKRNTGGSHLEWDILTGDPAGVVKGISGATVTYSASEDNDEIALKADMVQNGRPLQLSRIKLKQASGKLQRINYIKRQRRKPLIALQQEMYRDYITGAGTSGSVLGLENIIAETGTFATQARTASRALVGNVMDAGNVANTYSASAGSCTNGTAELVEVGTDVTASVSVGQKITITDSDGQDRWYWVTSVTLDGSDTDIGLSSFYEGDTDTGLSWTVEDEFYPGKDYGGANEFSLSKVLHARAHARFGMGGSPDLGGCNTFMFEKFESEVIAGDYGRTLKEGNRLGIDFDDGFEFKGMIITCDDFIPDGELIGLNTNFLDIETLAGYSDFALAEPGLFPVSAATSNKMQTLQGEIVILWYVCCSGVNKQFRITNMTKW